MFGFWPIYKKELKAYLQSPSTYVVLALFFLVVGWLFQERLRFFSLYCQQMQQMAMMYGQRELPNVTMVVVGPIFGVFNMLLLFTVPMLSMRLISEEKSRGTFELLVSCPISDWAIVLGKYLALLSAGLGVLLMSVLYPLIVWWVGRANGSAPEWNIVYSSWVGLFLAFATYTAFGVMASAMSENQIAACVITLIGLLFWYFLEGVKIENPVMQQIVSEFSIANHMENFIKGVLQLKDFAFYILASFLFLFIATKTLDARRWRL